LFAKSPHQKAFAAMGLVPCVTCHSNHDVMKTSDAMVGTTDKAVCVNCHAADSTGFKQAEAMRVSLDGLRESIQGATAILDQAENAGMEISQARFELRGASDALLKARAAIHLVDPATIQSLTEEGNKIAATTRAKGVKALEDLAFRHRGLWISVGILVLVIVGLVLKIREMDQRQDRQSAADRRG
jgi:predicted CXXCH cytochrome family protein